MWDRGLELWPRLGPKDPGRERPLSSLGLHSCPQVLGASPQRQGMADPGGRRAHAWRCGIAEEEGIAIFVLFGERYLAFKILVTME